METKIRAAIVGSTGYGGVELIRLLDAHPKVEIATVLSSSSAGEPLAAGYPHLTEIRTDVLEAIDPASLAKKADVVFLATPAGVAAKLAPEMLEAGLDVIDISGDFRLKSPQIYEAWYKKPAADPAWLERAVYGLAEVFGEDVRDARLIRTRAVTRRLRCSGSCRPCRRGSSTRDDHHRREVRRIRRGPRRKPRNPLCGNQRELQGLQSEPASTYPRD